MLLAGANITLLLSKASSPPCSVPSPRIVDFCASEEEKNNFFYNEMKEDVKSYDGLFTKT